MFTLALIGRPNVGKSTLFNRFSGKKLAIVDNTPGITRDWRDAEAQLFDRTFRVIDTAGLEESFDESIHGRMRKQTEHALAHADAALFIIDGRSGITPLDEHFAAWLRRQKFPVILGINKGENERAVQSAVGEAYGLGLGDPIVFSAEHATGMEELYHALEPLMPEDADDEDIGDEDGFSFDDLDEIEGDEDYEFQQEELDPDKPLKLAIVGRPNVGKSTLLNAIVNDERVMTGPEAGITRDAIHVDWDFEGRQFRLVDTAGMRRKSKVQDKIEKLSVEDSLRAIRLAQIVVLVLDGNAILDKQDLQIAEHVINEGRALILAVNKWDAVKDKDGAREILSERIEYSMAQIKDVPFVTLSALHGKNVEKVLKRALSIYDVWNKRTTTGQLNRWLGMMESRNPPPMISGRQNRLKYIAQIKTRPPTFALWVSRSEKLPDAYRRYIVNGLRRDYDLPGVPIRLLVRRSKNPYADKK